jgi:hypothetical protein
VDCPSIVKSFWTSEIYGFLDRGKPELSYAWISGFIWSWNCNPGLCSETALAGESQFHISTPWGLNPGPLMTGSKRVDHWTVELCMNEVRLQALHSCFILLNLVNFSFSNFWVSRFLGSWYVKRSSIICPRNVNARILSLKVVSALLWTCRKIWQGLCCNIFNFTLHVG